MSQTPETEKKNRKPEENASETTLAGGFYELIEIFAEVCIFVMLLFAFLVRLNIVDGNSMLNTLHDGESLLVSDLGYSPEPGDIVVIHKLDAGYYSRPIVKRVIATGGQVVDIDFNTWTLTVDGEVIDEPYRFLDGGPVLTSEYPFPITVPEHEVFVMGDNRNNSGDSRQIELRTIDERCLVGRALFRIFPLSKLGALKNPFGG